MKFSIIFSHVRLSTLMLLLALVTALACAPIIINVAAAQSDADQAASETDRIFSLIAKFDAGTITDAELKELEAVGLAEEALTAVSEEEEALLETESIEDDQILEQSPAPVDSEAEVAADITQTQQIPTPIFYALVVTNILLILCFLGMFLGIGRRM